MKYSWSLGAKLETCVAHPRIDVPARQLLPGILKLWDLEEQAEIMCRESGKELRIYLARIHQGLLFGVAHSLSSS